MTSPGCPHGRASWASCPHCLSVNNLPQPHRLLCLCCGNVTETSEPLNACPECGDRAHIPADLADTVTVTLAKHELRILTFWAAARAAELGDDAQKPMRVILERLGTQTDVALTLSQELSDLRATFPDSKVTVYRDSEETDE